MAMKQRGAFREGDTGNAEVPIIAMTANAMDGDKARFREAGMNDYLSKPIRPDDIRIMLERWLPVHGDDRS